MKRAHMKRQCKANQKFKAELAELLVWEIKFANLKSLKL